MTARANECGRAAPGAGGGGARRRRRGRAQSHPPHHPRVVPAASARAARRRPGGRRARPRAARRVRPGAAREPRGAVEKVSAQCATLAALLIRLYQWTVSPLLGPRCRFYPALLAVRARGADALRCARAAAGSRSSASAAATPGIPAASTRCRRRGVLLCTPCPRSIIRASTCGSRSRILLCYDYQAWMRDYAPPLARLECAERHRGSRGGTGRRPRQPACRSALDSHRRDSVRRGACRSGAVPASPAATGPSPPARCRRGARRCTCAPTCSIWTSALAAARSQRADLLAYPQVKGEADARAPRERRQSPQTLYELQTGLPGPGERAVPDALASFTSARSRLRTGRRHGAARAAHLDGRHGVTVTKTYVFRRGSYSIDLEYQVHNGSSAPWEARPTRRSCATIRRPRRSYFNVDELRLPRAGASGTAPSTASSDPTDAEDSHLALEVRNGWIAALQHHFVSAIVPPQDAPYRFTLSVAATSTCSRPAGPTQTIAPGASGAVRRRRCSSGRSCRRSSRRPRPSSGASPTTAACGSSRGRCSWLSAVHAADRQLGRRDHPRHVPPEAAVLSAVGGERPLDGEDEDARSRASRTCRRPTRTIARSSAAR